MSGSWSWSVCAMFGVRRSFGRNGFVSLKRTCCSGGGGSCFVRGQFILFRCGTVGGYSRITIFIGVRIVGSSSGAGGD